MPPHACNHPGCPALTDDRYCPEHKAIADAAFNDALPRRIRNGNPWHRFRAWYAACYPLCADPLNRHAGRPVPRYATHHIQPLARRPDLAYVEDNCASLCSGCHAEIEGMERRGIDTASLFGKISAETGL